MGLREQAASGGARFGCMGLLDRGRSLLLGELPQMGLIDLQGRRLLLEELPLHEAEGAGCFWGSSLRLHGAAR